MKYRSVKVKTKDCVFDSKREYKRYCELIVLEKAGQINNLKRQVKFKLIDKQKGTVRNERAVEYIADFVYEKEGKQVVEDAKGVKTRDYILKRKMMKYFYDIEVVEV